MFIYTFLFVSGVLVGKIDSTTAVEPFVICFRFFAATVLPDLAGHHFKQPYGKEYGKIR